MCVCTHVYSWPREQITGPSHFTRNCLNNMCWNQKRKAYPPYQKSRWGIQKIYTQRSSTSIGKAPTLIVISQKSLFSSPSLRPNSIINGTLNKQIQLVFSFYLSCVRHWVASNSKPSTSSSKRGHAHLYKPITVEDALGLGRQHKLIQVPTLGPRSAVTIFASKRVILFFRSAIFSFF